MPKIDFTFSGFCQAAEIDAVRDVEGTRIDVREMSAEKVVAGLNEGRFFLSLGDHLYTHRKNEIVLEDFQAHGSQ